jgi:Flp pilus assembly pilin Flp
LIRLFGRASEPKRFKRGAVVANDRQMSPTSAIFDDSGAVLVEYALVLALLSFAFVGGMELVEQATFSALVYFENELHSYASGTL